MNLFRKSLAVDPGGAVVAWGNCFLRVTAGLMVFYIHGWHKLEGWIAYLKHGTPWKLAEEVAGMHFLAPLASAVVATLVQFICGLLVAIGHFTRISSIALAGALGGAILHNLLAGRDSQLAVLYTLIVLSLAFMGGGRFSLDAKLFNRMVAIENSVDERPLVKSPLARKGLKLDSDPTKQLHSA